MTRLTWVSLCAIDGRWSSRCASSSRSRAISRSRSPRSRQVRWQYRAAPTLGQACGGSSRLPHRLRSQGVDAYVSHGSLGVEERREAEKAFAERSDCIIVATSTLELGIDVGDLDRVIQVDSPGRVSSFLQRLGRTGRRPGTSRNLLFLTTDDDALLLASALVALWKRGYVEPVSPPQLPYHVLAQQLLALTFQLGSWEPPTWRDWLGRIKPFAELGEAGQSIIDHMFANGLLFADRGLTGLGPEGDRRFAGQRFLDLLSVFWSEALFTVLHGRTEIGRVDEASFQLKPEQGTPVLLLGGRPWSVREIDWKDRLAYVEPIQIKGRSLWPGSAQAASFEVCRAMRDVLKGLDLDAHLTRRAREALGHLRDEYEWLPAEGTALVRGKGGRTRWWTFGGLKANATLADFVAAKGAAVSSRTNLAVVFSGDVSLENLQGWASEAAALARTLAPTSLAAESAGNVKFAECVPGELLMDMLRHRLTDPAGTEAVSLDRVTEIRIS